MTDYRTFDITTAYRLINTGPVVLISTRSKDGRYDIAPVAWSCPVRKEPTRILVGVGQRHQTYMNIMKTKQFGVCIPHATQADMVRRTGSVSGADIDKFAEFSIASFQAQKIDCRIPQGCIGYCECTLYESMNLDSLGLLIGECLYAGVNPESFDERLLSEKQAGKTLHHLGGKAFMIPADSIDTE